MARVMAVAFEQYGQLHYLDAGDLDFRVGDWVRFPTPDGIEVAQCVWAPEEVADSAAELPRCPGLANAADLARDHHHRELRTSAARVARQQISAHGLEMKVVGADVIATGDDQVVAIYFTAPRRIDFRMLVRDLAKALASRIDLRQVGARDAAALIGGVGSCGRELCCTSFRSDFEPVSARLARVQGLSPNPLQISGACGRLMCCLKYEHPLYVDFLHRAPAIGETVEVDGEPAVVTAHHVPAEAISVRNRSGEVSRCPLQAVCSTAQARKQRSDLLAERGQR